jgi:hypothetical protein
VSDPKFIGGAGLKKSGAGLSIATKELQARYLTYIAAEAVTKGDWVAINLNAPEPDSDYGNSVLLSDTGDALNQHAMGVVMNAAAIGAEVVVQVEGRCDIAKLPSDLGAGKMLSASAAAGVVGLRTATTGGVGVATAAAIQIAFSTVTAPLVPANHPSSSVWLINPLNQ